MQNGWNIAENITGISFGIDWIWPGMNMIWENVFSAKIFLILKY